MGLKFLSSEVAPHCIMLSFLFVSACVPGNDIGTKIPLVNEEVLAEQTVEVSKPTLDNPGLSDENDFDAVAERQTIESDAERLKRNQEVYTVIKPTNVPRRLILIYPTLWHTHLKLITRWALCFMNGVSSHRQDLSEIVIGMCPIVLLKKPFYLLEVQKETSLGSILMAMGLLVDGTPHLFDWR